MTTIILDSPAKLDRFCAWVRRLDLAKAWQIDVDLWRPTRTNPQNARLWLLHAAASQTTGYSPEEMHDHALCRHFGYTEREVKDPFTGEILSKRTPLKRSSSRNTKEFAQFMEATEIWYGSEFGVWLDSVPPIEAYAGERMAA